MLESIASMVVGVSNTAGAAQQCARDAGAGAGDGVWISYGHTLDFAQPLFEGSRLSSAVLLPPLREMGIAEVRIVRHSIAHSVVEHVT